MCAAAFLASAMTFASVIDFDDWRYTGEMQGNIGGQPETIQLLYEPPLFALGIPDTATTDAGILAISEMDLWPRGFFIYSFGPFHFTSVVDETVHPETGFFNARLLSEYQGTEAFFSMAPISGDTAAISYRGSTILLQPGDYILTVPAPSTLLLAVVAILGLTAGRRAALKSSSPGAQMRRRPQSWHREKRKQRRGGMFSYQQRS